MGSIGIIVIYVVALGLMMYFLAIKPQKKQQKAQQQLMDSIEIGDYVLTTSGFYGVIMDITDDDVIVEFGNNKNLPYLYAEESHCTGRKGKEFGRISNESTDTGAESINSRSGVFCYLFIGHYILKNT
mgnify:CR=1 FL=1